jgi:5-methylcytosine-specific restriction endonuclease McrA
MYRGDDRWRNYCAIFLKENPECYACGERATVVDHLVPAKGREEWFWKEGNYIPLCDRDHNYVTAKFDTNYTLGASIEEKVSWLNSRRMPTDTWSPKKVKIVPIK